MKSRVVTRNDIVKARQHLFREAEKYYKINKGDRRVQTPRVCCICSHPLSSLILNDNKYVSSHNHVRFRLNSFLILDVCEDINSCYRLLERKGELKNVDGR